MENPEKKKTNTGPLIGAIAAIVLCGVTGLCGLLPVSILTFADVWQTDFTGAWGILPLCGSLLFIAIGVVVPIVLLKKKKPKEPKAGEIIPPGDPLPPAS
jgi:amino acid permease